MVNFTELIKDTTTQEFIPVQISVIIVIFFMNGIFVYFIVIILNVFCNTPQIRETSRYILFIHMLLNDVSNLFIAYLLTIFHTNNIVLTPIPLCLVIACFAECTFRITPYNLAIMSLERYAAICHPLRYAELCTARRSYHAIAYMWVVGMIPTTANVIAFWCSANLETFYRTSICYWKVLTLNNFQVILRPLTDALSFSIVGLIITYTYVKVMLVARRMDSGKSASKAAKTLLLHAFQLLLSMLSLTNTLTETYLFPYFRYISFTNLVLVMCLPKVVSPLIYGWKDEVFGKAMRKPPCCFKAKGM